MLYPANVVPDGSGWMVSFPDIPEALTSGVTREQALEMARDALCTAIGFYIEDKRAVPAPSRVKHGQEIVGLPVNLAAKVLKVNEMVLQRHLKQ